MSFVSNKMASLLATLVVVGLALFCSSAAQAHGDHGPAAVEVPVRVLAALEDRAAASGTDGDEALRAGATGSDDAVGGHRTAGTTCCGTGMANCMAATVGSSGRAFAAPAPACHDPARPADALRGAPVDGLIRPPRPTV